MGVERILYGPNKSTDKSSQLINAGGPCRNIWVAGADDAFAWQVEVLAMSELAFPANTPAVFRCVQMDTGNGRYDRVLS